MRSLLISAALAGLGLALNFANDEKWTTFKDKYGKVYKSSREERGRYKIFRDNLIEISRFNAGSPSMKKGINKFSDLTYDQFKKQYLMSLPYPEEESEFECPHKYETVVDDWQTFGTSLDWRTTNNPLGLQATVGVKDQGGCGSCYVFSATAAMEGSMCMQGFKNCTDFEGLSEQHVLDCGSYDMKDAKRPWYEFHGCSGGWQSNVFQYIYRNGGVACRGKYPYFSGDTGEVGECYYTTDMSHGAPDKNICGTINKNEWSANTVQLMKSALLEKGPLAVGMFVGGSFMEYASGVYTKDNAPNDCPDIASTGVNHAVNAVGYGQEDVNGTMTDYWIIRNSWSDTWGDAGHIKVEMGADLCGIEGNVQFANMMPGPEEEPEEVHIV